MLLGSGYAWLQFIAYFEYFIVTLIGIGIAVYIGFKIRALIARMLVREEEVF